MIETVDLADVWIYQTLAADAALNALVGDRISGTLSNELPDTPYVTFLCQSTLDVIGTGGIRISTDNLYEVKAVAQTASWDDVRPIARRIFALLDRPGQTMAVEDTGNGSGSLTCIRDHIIQYPEVDDGLQYRHLGAMFRIRTSGD